VTAQKKGRVLSGRESIFTQLGEAPGVVICELCGYAGPVVDELITQAVERQVAALASGWRYGEADRWLCWQCLDEPLADG
jgi:hypothetical protein